jgi:hypothetical protein
MNGENNHIFHTSALDGMAPNPVSRKVTWPLFAAQFWLLVAFCAMSLVAIAAESLIEGSRPLAVSVLLVVAGGALFPLAWLNIGWMLERAEGMSGGDPASQAKPKAPRPLTQLPLALQR